jgi:hypothetical protein
MDYDTAFSNVSNLRGAVQVIRKLREENAKLKRRLTALEQNFLEQQIEITNICRRIQNDFPVSPWDDE